MPTELNHIQLKFNCTANWDDTQQLNDCRFCSYCQKKVYDFTGSTREDYEQILAENNNRACGRFTAEQVAAPAMVKPFWMKWVSAAMILLGFNFIACKEKGSQSTKGNRDIKATECKKTPDFVMGKPLKIQPDTIDLKNVNNSVSFIDDDFTMPSFPGGEAAMAKYLKQSIPYIKGTPDGRVIASFRVSTKGNIADIKILRGLTPAAEQAVIKALKNSPKWHPGTHHNKPIPTSYTIPVSFKG